MRRLVLFGLLTAGCTFQRADAVPGDSDPVDPDAGTPVCTSFSTQVDTCKLALEDDLVFAGIIKFDTTTGTLSDPNGPVPVPTMTLETPSGQVQAILAANVSFAPNTVLRAEGMRPLAILASGTISVAAARIDVGQGGAGARTGCGDTPTRGQNRDGGAGGGGGGGFGGTGGTGGNGNSDGTGATGGTAGAITTPLGALGGCAGAAGGDDNNDNGGNGGAGGGAVYLAAGVKVDIASTAVIYAGGQGGQGGRQSGIAFGDAGGGGGGSGGMIFLEAPSITSMGILAANGGGGGEGSGNQQGGASGTSGTANATRANGGGGSSAGGSDGGQGAAGATMIGDSVTTGASGGGGGGGGGAGVIWIFAPMKSLGGMISPPPT